MFILKVPEDLFKLFEGPQLEYPLTIVQFSGPDSKTNLMCEICFCPFSNCAKNLTAKRVRRESDKGLSDISQIVFLKFKLPNILSRIRIHKSSIGHKDRSKEMEKIGPMRLL